MKIPLYYPHKKRLKERVQNRKKKYNKAKYKDLREAQIRKFTRR